MLSTLVPLGLEIVAEKVGILLQGECLSDKICFRIIFGGGGGAAEAAEGESPGGGGVPRIPFLLTCSETRWQLG